MVQKTRYLWLERGKCGFLLVLAERDSKEFGLTISKTKHRTRTTNLNSWEKWNVSRRLQEGKGCICVGVTIPTFTGRVHLWTLQYWKTSLFNVSGFTPHNTRGTLPALFHTPGLSLTSAFCSRALRSYLTSESHTWLFLIDQNRGFNSPLMQSRFVRAVTSGSRVSSHSLYTNRLSLWINRFMWQSSIYIVVCSICSAVGLLRFNIVNENREAWVSTVSDQCGFTHPRLNAVASWLKLGLCCFFPPQRRQLPRRLWAPMQQETHELTTGLNYKVALLQRGAFMSIWLVWLFFFLMLVSFFIMWMQSVTLSPNSKSKSVALLFILRVIIISPFNLTLWGRGPEISTQASHRINRKLWESFPFDSTTEARCETVGSCHFLH